MLRIAVLALLVAVSPAFGQASKSDLEDEAKRIESRTMPSYEQAMRGRDVFAQLHDTVSHGAFNNLKAARTAYDGIKRDFQSALAAGDLSKASKRLEDLKAASETLDTKLSVYVSSSSDGVQKIQIGLGVIAFVICGLVYLVFRRRKQPKRS